MEGGFLGGFSEGPGWKEIANYLAQGFGTKLIPIIGADRADLDIHYLSTANAC